MSLILQNISCERGSFQLTVPRLELNSGQILAIMGASGSGKSTLLRAVGGFVPDLRGEILVNGNNVSHLPAERRKIAVAFQKSPMFSHLNVFENIAFPLRLQKLEESEIKAQVSDWMTQLSIESLSERLIGELSGGQEQRVAIARSLITGFPVVLLDEPFAGLDSPLKKQLYELLKNLVKKTNTALMVVTHDGKDALSYADSICVLEAGRVIAHGAVNEVKENDSPLVQALIGS